MLVKDMKESKVAHKCLDRGKTGGKSTDNEVALDVKMEDESLDKKELMVS